jgi:AraC-like DNA-binding protein
MLIEPIDIFQIALRGGASALALLMAVSFARSGAPGWTPRLGALFGVGVACYALLSSGYTRDALGVGGLVLSPFAILNGIFFWWFATALFRDDFRWTWIRFAPLAIVVVCSFFFYRFELGSAPALVALMVWQSTSLAMMGHAIFLAVRDRSDDLMETRRSFRVVFAITMGSMGVAVTAFEIAYAGGEAPELAKRVHALALFILAFVFAVWAQQGRQLIGEPCGESRAANDRPRNVAPEDGALAARLETAMEEGAYTVAGLTVGALATQLGAPEHRLRKLINRDLGYRNFTAFLNSRRLEDAKTALSDPENGRKQILLIALELGFGSIAPFNRAFKAETGQTPTEYCRQALSAAAA